MSHYHLSIYDRSHPVDSYWEASARPFKGGQTLKDGDACDVAIIGGGYVGLSAAYHLARESQLDVRVLEAGSIAWGASGRNGGFSGLHPAQLNFDQLIKRYGLDEARRYIASQVEAVSFVRDLMDHEGIEADIQGNGIYEVAHHERAFAALREEADLLQRAYQLPVRLIEADEFAETVYTSNEQFGALWNGVGFGLHPLKFARGLADLSERAGAILHPHTHVTGWEKANGEHSLSSEAGTLRAKKVIVATNGFTRDDLHPSFSGRLMPILSNIFTTRPLSEDELAAQNWQTDCPCSNTRNMLFYYRVLPDKRVLFGARGDVTGRPEDGQRQFEWMKRRFGEVFPAWQDIETTHFWRGLVCFSRNFTPAMGQLQEDPSVFYGLAFHGNGVAAAPWVGRELAQMVIGQKSAKATPNVWQGPLQSIPFVALRRWYLRAALVYYHMKDH